MGAYDTATLLASGEVLIAGGLGTNSAYLASAQLYDPTSGASTPTGLLNTGRALQTATLLANGKILIAGGQGTYSAYLASAELYDMVSRAWTTTGPLNTVRAQHTATLLANGKVLVVGGCNDNDILASAELYDPAGGTCTPTGSLKTARYLHTATLLPNGNVLVAGGYATSGNAINSAELYDAASRVWTTTASLQTALYTPRATLLTTGKVLVGGVNTNGFVFSSELYDVGLGFNVSWQPQITGFTSPLATNGCLKLTGSQFRGVSEGSGGNGCQDSPADYPVVQLRRLDNEQSVYLLSTNWQTNSFASATLNGLPPGWAMATMFVNGIPGASILVRLDAVPMPPIQLTNTTKPKGSACQFSFTNLPGLGFTVLATTNPALSLSHWTVVASAKEVSPGQYQFSDPQATNIPQRFYRVRSP